MVGVMGDLDFTPSEEEEHGPPIIVTLAWSCELAVGPPQWQGTDSYECPECPGEGEVALPFDDLEFDPPLGDPPAELIGVDFPVYCTACGQELEELHHFDPDSVKAAIAKWERVTAARKKPC